MPIESFLLPGPAGPIECLLRHPPDGPSGSTPTCAAVVCHPHPLFGGTMHNKVVHAAAVVLSTLGLPVLRFNFRGVGLSGGRHDAGHGEQDDMRVVLDELSVRYPGMPLVVAGYSFGAYVGLKAGCGDSRVTTLIGIGVPVALYDFSFLRECDKRLTLICADHDRFGPLALVMAFAATLPGGARVLPVADAEHGFEGKLAEVAGHVASSIAPGLITGAAAPPPSSILVPGSAGPGPDEPPQA